MEHKKEPKKKRQGALTGTSDLCKNCDNSTFYCIKVTEELDIGHNGVVAKLIHVVCTACHKVQYKMHIDEDEE